MTRAHILTAAITSTALAVFWFVIMVVGASSTTQTDQQCQCWCHPALHSRCRCLCVRGLRTLSCVRQGHRRISYSAARTACTCAACAEPTRQQRHTCTACSARLTPKTRLKCGPAKTVYLAPAAPAPAAPCWIPSEAANCGGGVYAGAQHELPVALNVASNYTGPGADFAYSP